MKSKLFKSIMILGVTLCTIVVIPPNNESDHSEDFDTSTETEYSVCSDNELWSIDPL